MSKVTSIWILTWKQLKKFFSKQSFLAEKQRKNIYKVEVAMNSLKLDQEEQALLNAFEADEFESVLTEDRKSNLVKSAEAVFKKDKRLNIRISSRDLAALQRRALEEGLPYQTLVASVLHKYASGSLQDLSASKPQRQNLKL